MSLTRVGDFFLSRPQTISVPWKIMNGSLVYYNLGATLFSWKEIGEISWSSQSLFFTGRRWVLGQKKIPYSRKGLLVSKGKGLLPLNYIVLRSVQSYFLNVVNSQTLYLVFVVLGLSTCFGLLNLKGLKHFSVNVSTLKLVLG